MKPPIGGFHRGQVAWLLCLVIVVVALALLCGVAAGARGRDLALAFVLATALKLLELLRDGVDLDEVRHWADLVWSQERFVHSDV